MGATDQLKPDVIDEEHPLPVVLVPESEEEREEDKKRRAKIKREKELPAPFQWVLKVLRFLYRALVAFVRAVERKVYELLALQLINRSVSYYRTF